MARSRVGIPSPRGSRPALISRDVMEGSAACFRQFGCWVGPDAQVGGSAVDPDPLHPLPGGPTVLHGLDSENQPVTTAAVPIGAGLGDGPDECCVSAASRALLQAPSLRVIPSFG